ncbi:hypothetical protein MTP10_29525 [Nonomuraea sp. 3-1Str]|uniref:hypothetical protein n=1 Tax=Nonomuraea sp. 3-1Str TaxID=2929801 RepID=UPI0028665FE0|nr:hypothetical protein [Nonomuraea sp. 3-1Str]MDR8412859.1 hypothetical protein [Nonomuraea sp. 3-1Str]
MRTLPMVLLIPVVALGLLAGCTTLQNATAGNEQWRLAHRAPSLEFGASLVPLGEREAWAFGTRRVGWWHFGPTAYHWDGERWRASPLPSGLGAGGGPAGASSPANVWLVTSGDDDGQRALRWDGRTWTTMRTLPSQSVQEVEVFGDTDVWFFGDDTWHYTGSAWVRADVPVQVTRASARSATDIWAIGRDRRDETQPRVAHYDGTGWRIEPLGDALPASDTSSSHDLGGITADASGVWITADVSDMTARTTTPLLLHRSGNVWRTERVTAVPGPWRETFDPVPDGRGGHWFLGSADVNGDDAALAPRSPAGVWTLRPVGAPGTAEFTSLAGVPGGSWLLATGSFGDVRGIFRHRLPGR